MPSIPAIAYNLQVFLKIRSSLTRCVKLISRGHALLLLSQAFKVSLLVYLSAHLVLNFARAICARNFFGIADLPAFTLGDD